MTESVNPTKMNFAQVSINLLHPYSCFCSEVIYFKHLHGDNNFCKFWPVVKLLLLLSCGQATVEQGFSMNKNVCEI